MWPRVVEVMLACWLAVSPLVFQRDEATARLWAIDLASAGIVAALALASFWTPLRRVHLGILVVAVVLIGVAMFKEYPPPPEEQNHVLVGLLLLLFAIVPTESSQPPTEWQRFNEEA